jgi:hypothetical protein
MKIIFYRYFFTKASITAFVAKLCRSKQDIRSFEIMANMLTKDS